MTFCEWLKLHFEKEPKFFYCRGFREILVDGEVQ